MDDSGMQASRCGLTSQFVKNLVTTIHNFVQAHFSAQVRVPSRREVCSSVGHEELGPGDKMRSFFKKNY